MKQISLGNSDLAVSEMCLGTMYFGTTVNEPDSFAFLNRFTDAGGTFIDTSNNYAHWIKGASGNESELLLGRWLRTRGNRSNFVIATKVGFDRHGLGAGLRAHQIQRWCYESLRKLGIDTIDLYYAHVDDPNTPLEETLEAFYHLKKNGVIRAIGASNYFTWRLLEANMISEQREYTAFSVLQQRYTYLYAHNGFNIPYPFNENASTEKLSFLAKYNIPLVAYSCLAGGGYENSEHFPAFYIQDPVRLQTLKEIAHDKNISCSSLVLAWLMHSWQFPNRPQIVPLFSASSMKHLEESICAADIVLDNEEVKKLNGPLFERQLI